MSQLLGLGGARLHVGRVNHLRTKLEPQPSSDPQPNSDPTVIQEPIDPVDPSDPSPTATAFPTCITDGRDGRFQKCFQVADGRMMHDPSNVDFDGSSLNRKNPA